MSCKTTYVTEKGDVPKGPHYAIITFDTIFIPGDETSKLRPGHGYGEQNKPIVVYQAYTDKDEWGDAVQQLTLANTYKPNFPNFVAMYVQPATVTVKTNVVIDL